MRALLLIYVLSSVGFATELTHCETGNEEINAKLSLSSTRLTGEIFEDAQAWNAYYSREAKRIGQIASPIQRNAAWVNLIDTYIAIVSPLDKPFTRIKTRRFLQCLQNAELTPAQHHEFVRRFASLDPAVAAKPEPVTLKLLEGKAGARWKRYLETHEVRILALQTKEQRAQAWRDFIESYIDEVVPMDPIAVTQKTNRLISSIALAELSGAEKIAYWEKFVAGIRAASREKLLRRIADPKENAQLVAIMRSKIHDPEYGFTSYGYATPDGIQIRIGHGRELLAITPDGAVYQGKSDYEPKEIIEMRRRGKPFPPYPPKKKPKKLSRRD